MKSMTGFGRCVAERDGYQITAEIRAVNHRFLETSIHLPRMYSAFETKVKDAVRNCISRGKVEVGMTIRSIQESSVRVSLNHDLITAYIDAVEQEKRTLEDERGIAPVNDVTMSVLMQFPEVVNQEQKEIDLDAVWLSAQPVLEEAIQNFLQMRETEGEKLKADLSNRLDNIEEMTRRIEVLAPQSVELYYDKLLKKLQVLLEDRNIDESRLVTEAGIVAEKLAVDEETVRLHSHIAQFRDFLDSQEPIGRKMDFLVQELNREVNTTGSKSQSLEITKLVVDMKSEIEKIREQIQNVE